jgi:hypothetical protein
MLWNSNRRQNFAAYSLTSINPKASTQNWATTSAILPYGLRTRRPRCSATTNVHNSLVSAKTAQFRATQQKLWYGEHLLGTLRFHYLQKKQKPSYRICYLLDRLLYLDNAKSRITVLIPIRTARTRHWLRPIRLNRSLFQLTHWNKFIILCQSCPNL